MNKPRLLDLFCGAGGAGVGYFQAGFDVVGVDNRPQKAFPFEFIQADALEYLAAHGHEYDVIHASPPCQRYSRETRAQYKENHPDLIEPVRTLLVASGKPYIIENVEDARHLLINPIKLCGSMLNLGVWRHRYFEIGNSSLWFLVPPCQHDFIPVLITGTSRRKGQRRRDPSLASKRQASGINWMNLKELDEAIPPAYTEYIGRRLIASIQVAA